MLDRSSMPTGPKDRTLEGVTPRRTKRPADAAAEPKADPRTGAVSRAVGRLMEARSASSVLKAAVLEDAIRLVNPSIIADLREPILRAYKERPTVSGQVVSIREYFDEQGLLLGDAYRDAGSGSGISGTSTGVCLYLLSDERLALVQRTGRWCDSTEGWDEWTATLTTVPPTSAVHGVFIEEVLGTLSAALRRHARLSGLRETRLLADTTLALLGDAGPDRSKRGGPWDVPQKHEVVLEAGRGGRYRLFGRRAPMGRWVYANTDEVAPSRKRQPRVVTARLDEALASLHADWPKLEPHKIHPELLNDLREVVRSKWRGSGGDKATIENLRRWQAAMAKETRSAERERTPESVP